MSPGGTGCWVVVLTPWRGALPKTPAVEKPRRAPHTGGPTDGALGRSSTGHLRSTDCRLVRLDDGINTIEPEFVECGFFRMGLGELRCGHIPRPRSGCRLLPLHLRDEGLNLRLVGGVAKCVLEGAGECCRERSGTGLGGDDGRGSVPLRRGQLALNRLLDCANTTLIDLSDHVVNGSALTRSDSNQ